MVDAPSERIVLLAEDDPDHEALFCRAVVASGIPCRVDVVHDGVEAIEYLFGTGARSRQDRQQGPDLIVLDLRLPRMNGLEVLQVLRRVRGHNQTRFSPLIVLSCSEDEQDIAQAYRLGAQSYISKPSDFPGFANAVRDTLQYWLSLNRPLPKGRGATSFVHEGL